MTEREQQTWEKGRDRGHNGPVTAAEVARWMERHERDSIQAHRDMLRIIEKQDSRIDALDDRTDRMGTRISIIFAVVAVLWSIFLVIAPVIRTVLGLTG